MLMPLEAEGKTGFRIRDSGRGRTGVRIQQSGVRMKHA
jgi:hypothetical protein